MATDKNVEIKGENNTTKYSRNVAFVRMGRSNFLDSHKFLDASSDKLSTTLTSFPPLDSIAMEDEQFMNKLGYAYE